MNGLTEWTRDLLMSRGALLEADAGVLRALLPTEVAGALGCGEWLSLDFEASAGADDAGEWLGRLSPGPTTQDRAGSGEGRAAGSASDGRRFRADRQPSPRSRPGARGRVLSRDARSDSEAHRAKIGRSGQGTQPRRSH